MDIITLMQAQAYTNDKFLGKTYKEVATRCGGYFGNLTDGTDTGGTFRLKHTNAVYSYDHKLKYGNYYYNITTSPYGDTPGPNTIKVGASIDYNNIIYPLTFKGSKLINIEPGGIVESDPLSIELPKGATFFTRSYVEVQNGEKYPRGFYTFPSQYEGKTTGNITESGTPTNNSNFAYHPLAVLAKTTENVASIFESGDSIGTGVGADLIYTGFLDKALNGNFGYVKMTKPGETGYMFNTLNGKKYRTHFLQYCDIAICNYCINDIAVGQTVEQIKATLTGIWRNFKIRGLKVFQTTITPRTTSTDSWATVANQTPFIYESVRVEINTWLRDYNNWDAETKALLDGVFDVTSKVESGLNSGKWAVGMCYVADAAGVHPSEAGHVAMSTAIDTSLFVI